MRILFLLIVAANLWVYALGQGWLGLRPADEGRDAARLNQEMKSDQVKVLRS